MDLDWFKFFTWDGWESSSINSGDCQYAQGQHNMIQGSPCLPSGQCFLGHIRSRRVLLDGPILSDHLFTLSLQFGQRFHKDWMNIDIIFYPWMILWTTLSFFFPNIVKVFGEIFVLFTYSLPHKK